MTQKQVAKVIGMTPTSLSRKLKGKRLFTLPEVIAVCRTLEINDPRPYFFDPE